MFKRLSFGCIALLIASAVSVAEAGEKASTSILPAALESAGIDAASLVSVEQALAVRGTGGTAQKITTVTQTKSFAVVGQAEGELTLLEGVFAKFEFGNSRGMAVSGSVGGLEVHIRVAENGDLSMQGLGKALQETTKFVGEYIQQFQQTY